MSKNSIGQFISALRKANGMTQKQLAEKLNVSDKAVSRWERDESAPDISLIPVIADIFDVSTDEILRGERKPAQSNESSNLDNNKKSKKQIEYIINRTLTKFSTKSMIAVGLSILGLLLAMTCNFVLIKALLGFFVGCTFYFSAIIWETIYVKLTLAAIKSNEFDDNMLYSAKNKILNIALRTYSVILTVIAITLPLAIFAWDAYVGIAFKDWLGYAVLFGIITAVICIMASLTANYIAVKKSNYTETVKYKNEKLTRSCIILLAAVLFVTFIGQAVFNSAFDAADFSEGIAFTDMDEFKTYIENDSNEVNSATVAINVEDISDEEEKEYITDVDGNIICEYFPENNSVAMMNVEWNDNEPTIITYTFQALKTGNDIMNIINVCWIALYLIEAVLINIICKRKIINC